MFNTSKAEASQRKHSSAILMLTLIFIWSLFTAPSDRMICSMWINRPPDERAMRQAGCAWDEGQAAAYVVRVFDWRIGVQVCESPAASLPELDCKLILWPWDNYFIQVWEPDAQTQLCNLVIQHAGPPTQDEISAACQDPAALTCTDCAWQLVSTGTLSPPQPSAPVCPLPPLTAAQLPASAAGLATDKDYQLLDFWLRWYYGRDADIVAWQNQWDAEIWAAGKETSVPPRLLKTVFAQETQFWPVWSKDSREAGEVGLGQLSDDGADLVMHYSPALFDQVCSLAIHAPRCDTGYELLSADDRQRVRDVFRSKLILWGTPTEAAEQAKGQMLTWARVLATYYCAAGEAVRPGGASPSWDYALAAYHAGLECVAGGNICLAGEKYLEKLK